MKRIRCGKILTTILLLGYMLSLLLCGCDTEPKEYVNWPMFMYDLHNTGCSPSDAPDSLYVAWEFNTGQRLFGSPVVCNGTVYQVGYGSLFALDSETGNVLWSSELPVVGSTPFVTDEFLYVGTCNGMVALNPKTGELVWQVQLADFSCDPLEDDLSTFLASSPIVIDTRVIMCTHRNWTTTFSEPPRPDPEGVDRVVCLDSETGVLLWEFPLHERAGYSPAYMDRNVIINAHELKVLDVETGQELWSYPAEGLYDTSPVVNGNTIVTVSKDDSVVSSIDTATHELLWEYNLNSDVYSTPAVCDGKIIVLTRDGMLVALDQTAGKLLWKKEIHEKPDSSAHDILRNTAANFVSSPAIADNKIYVGLWSGTFLCLNLETGKTLWKYHTGGSIVASPAVADGKVFIASTDGKIYCFGINPEPPSRLFEHSFLLLGSTGIIIVIFIIYRIINRKNKK